MLPKHKSQVKIKQGLFPLGLCLRPHILQFKNVLAFSWDSSCPAFGNMQAVFRFHHRGSGFGAHWLRVSVTALSVLNWAAEFLGWCCLLMLPAQIMLHNHIHKCCEIHYSQECEVAKVNVELGERKRIEKKINAGVYTINTAAWSNDSTAPQGSTELKQIFHFPGASDQRSVALPHRSKVSLN